MEAREINISREIILRIMKEAGVTQAEIAPLVGMKNQKNVSAALQHDMKVSLFIKMLAAMGYEIVIQKKAAPMQLELDVPVMMRL